uniref:Inositol oxygenase n=1 Tax=Varanus komodoensis TaxID=61221 RepID=A0A8D2LW11_VARKO
MQYYNKMTMRMQRILRESPDSDSALAKKAETCLHDGPLTDRVYRTYLLMHTNQTVEFVRKKNEEYGGCSRCQMSIMEVLDLLDNVVDESDPDVDFPNSYHAYQTAEGIRKAHPDKDWFHLVGLLHDMGKVLALFGEPQWAVVGDTFPTGCKVQPSVVFWDSTFLDNPDLKNPVYSTEYGLYQPHCGLEKVLMSWGHDGKPPRTAFYMVRFHSFYPWHTGGDYMHLCSEQDLRMLPWVQELKYGWGASGPGPVREAPLRPALHPKGGASRPLQAGAHLPGCPPQLMCRVQSPLLLFPPAWCPPDFVWDKSHPPSFSQLLGGAIRRPRGHQRVTAAPSPLLSCSKFDLYTKSGDLPNPQELKPYYQSLVDKYCPGRLAW